MKTSWCKIYNSHVTNERNPPNICAVSTNYNETYSFLQEPVLSSLSKWFPRELKSIHEMVWNLFCIFQDLQEIPGDLTGAFLSKYQEILELDMLCPPLPTNPTPSPSNTPTNESIMMWEQIATAYHHAISLKSTCPFLWRYLISITHYNDVIMGMIASQITSLTIIYSTVYSGTDQRKQQSSASLAFVCRIHRRPVNSLHKWPVTRKMFPFDNVIMYDYQWNDVIDGLVQERHNSIANALE